MPDTTEPTELLAAATIAAYRDAFKANVVVGRTGHLIIPYHFLPSFFLPILYFTIPHTRRPWLYRARWLLLAVVLGFNMDMILRTSSANIALAYATGLWGFWSMMQNLAMFIWFRPQFDAERVVKRRKIGGKSAATPNGDAASTSTSTSTSKSDSEQQQYEYYWQAFPADGSFAERLNWAFDLYATFRGAGWNWAVPNVPNPQRPEKPLSGELVKMDTIPLETPTGYRTYRSEREFLVTKLSACVYAYLAVDVLKVLMVKDPWWILGPGPRLDAAPPPSYLAPVPGAVLHVVHNTMLLLALHAAILGIISFHDLFQFYIMSRIYPLRGELWHHSSVFGSPRLVLDRGLAGFWGGTWHQTFRHGFAGPGAYLTRAGHLVPGSEPAKLAAMGLAFLQSGLLHGCGSYTSLGHTWPLNPPLFFLLSGLGIVVQKALCTALKPCIGAAPRWLRRAGNLSFVVLWLHYTCWPLAADFAQAAIWHLEPVPLSVVRALGFGQVDHAVWRIDEGTKLGWIAGRHWWQSGLG